MRNTIPSLSLWHLVFINETRSTALLKLLSLNSVPRKMLFFVNKLNRQNICLKCLFWTCQNPSLRGMLSHVQIFSCIIQTLIIAMCYFLMLFFFLPFFFRVCKHNLHLLIACMTMILPTQVQAPHQSWKHLLRIELNLKIRAYLSALNYN